MVSLVPGQLVAIHSNGYAMMALLVDLPSIRMNSLEPGGMMDTRVMSTHGLKLQAATSEYPVWIQQLQLMKPALMKPPQMTIQQSRLTHMKENPVMIQACNVLKA